MDEAPNKRRGRLALAVAGAVAAVAIAIPVSGAFADSTPSQSAAPQGSSAQQAPGLEGVQSQGGQGQRPDGRDCPKGARGQSQGGQSDSQGSGSDSSSSDSGVSAPADTTQL